MKKALLDILTSEMVSNHNIEQTSNELFLKNGDNNYSFKFSNMSKVYKDGGQTVVILFINDNILLAKFTIFEETLKMQF